MVEGLDRPTLTGRIDPGANTIAWLVWHLSRIEDDHIADVAGTEQLWTSEGWFGRSGLPFGAHEHGYGHTGDQVAAVDLDPQFLIDYHDAAHRQAAAYVEKISDDDLARIVDDRWDPPVTLGVRLVSVVNDCTQHVGQAAFIRGVLERRRG